MRILFLAFLLFLASCKTEVKDTQDLEEVAELQSAIEQLKMENQLKDSMMNESLAFFNEIQNNLVAINIRSQSLKQISQNPEEKGYDRQWMIDEINQINGLRVQNADKIKKLQSQISSSNINLSELNTMIAQLQQEMAMRDEQIAGLREEMGQKDQEYTKLFDAYQQKEYDLVVSQDERNEAYYVYGTEKELIENGVLEKKNGFIGIGKKVKMKGDFNQSYFSKLDIRNKTEIKIAGNKPKLMSVHPSQSYQLTESGKSSVLKIVNASEFWKASKYLIIAVQ